MMRNSAPSPFTPQPPTVIFRVSARARLRTTTRATCSDRQFRASIFSQSPRCFLDAHSSRKTKIYLFPFFLFNILFNNLFPRIGCAFKCTFSNHLWGVHKIKETVTGKLCALFRFVREQKKKALFTSRSSRTHSITRAAILLLTAPGSETL